MDISRICYSKFKVAKVYFKGIPLRIKNLLFLKIIKFLLLITKLLILLRTLLLIMGVIMKRRLFICLIIVLTQISI
uniref:Uncharacterized protein n=1 Tax=Arundo donax TaxID=35708 RepID=A0A0A8XQM6_ARUDO